MCDVRKVLATTSLLLIVVAPCFGQGLVTDRPSVTASAVTVPRGLIQLEAGATLSSEDQVVGDDLSTLTAGEALVRWGFANRLEARVTIPNFTRVSSGGDATDGFDDVSLGAKYQFGPLDKEHTFDLALIGAVSIPSGSDAFTADAVVPVAVLAASKALGGAYSIGGQVSSSLPDNGDGRSFEWSAAVIGSASVGIVAPFVELAIDIPDSGTAPITAHVGVTAPLSDRFQIDAHGGFGLSETAPDWFFGAGLAAGL